MCVVNSECKLASLRRTCVCVNSFRSSAPAIDGLVRPCLESGGHEYESDLIRITESLWVACFSIYSMACWNINRLFMTVSDQIGVYWHWAIHNRSCTSPSSFLRTDACVLYHGMVQSHENPTLHHRALIQLKIRSVNGRWCCNSQCMWRFAMTQCSIK